MNVSQAAEKRLEVAVMNRLRNVMEPAIREAMMEVLHGGRRTQNGVQEPGVGKCREIWDALDLAPNAPDITLQGAFMLAHEHDWNENTMRIQYYRWRTFNGYGNRNH